MAEETLRAVCRDVALLAANVSLDRATDARRVLPTIAPAVLWRVLPRLLRKCAPHMDGETARDFALNLAGTIEGYEAAPVIGAGKGCGK